MFRIHNSENVNPDKKHKIFTVCSKLKKLAKVSNPCVLWLQVSKSKPLVPIKCWICNLFSQFYAIKFRRQYPKLRRQIRSQYSSPNQNVDPDPKARQFNRYRVRYGTVRYGTDLCRCGSELWLTTDQLVSYFRHCSQEKIFFLEYGAFQADNDTRAFAWISVVCTFGFSYTVPVPTVLYFHNSVQH